MPAPLPPVREQDRIRQEWLKLRLERVLPEVMRRHGVAMWIVVCREYNEDPVFFSLVSPSVMAARRRTILVFHDRGAEKGVERLALGGGSNGGLYQVYRDPAVEGRELWGQGQWALLRKLVDERKPATIAIEHLADPRLLRRPQRRRGEQLEAALGPWTRRIVRAEDLALEYLAIRVPEMLPTYQHLMRVVARAHRAGLLERGHHPGKTTTEDVVWWLRQQVSDLGDGRVVPALGQRAAARHAAPATFTATADRGGGHRARRPPPHRLRRQGDGPRHRHPARGLRPEARRDGRPRGAAPRSRELEPPAGPPGRAHEAGPHGQRGAGWTRWRR